MEAVLQVVGLVVVGVVALMLILSKEPIVRAFQLVLLAISAYAGLIAVIITSTGTMLYVSIAMTILFTAALTGSVIRFMQTYKAVSSLPQVHQVKEAIRIQKSKILKDLSDLRARMLSVQSNLKSDGSASVAANWKRIIDEIDETKLEVEATTIGEDNLKSAAENKKALDSLLSLDSEVQDAVSKLVQTTMRRLDEISSGQTNVRFADELGAELLPSLSKIRQKIRERQVASQTADL